MPSCCVRSCSNRGGNSHVTFHKVPFKMKETWYKILNKHGTKNPSIHMVVCSDHFRPQDLDRDGFRTVLKKGAVPCLYLDKSKQVMKKKLTIHLQKGQSEMLSFVRIEESDWKQRKMGCTLPVVVKLHGKDRREEIRKADRDSEVHVPPAEIKVVEANIRERQNEEVFSEENATDKEVTDCSWFSDKKVKIVDIKSILKSESSL